MSLAAIETIRGVEDAMEKARTEARAEGQRRVAAAQREGKALLEQSKAEAAARAAEAMRQAERQGEQRRQEILAQARESCERLTREAETRMASAARMIAERVVEG